MVLSKKMYGFDFIDSRSCLNPIESLALRSCTEIGTNMNGCVPQCASFYEVIDPSMEATHMEPFLVIPKAFMKKFRSYLSHMITLEAPSRVMFKAHIEVDEKKHFRITFGWKELAKHLGIRSGSLVIFELAYKAHFRGIPKSFAVKHMKADPEHVALIDARNKAWSVIFLGHKNDHLSFCGGWKYFVLDHKLKCGDICIFEKMSTKAFTAFNVHTFRVHKGDRQELVNKVPPRLSSVIACRCT
ncbi:hypothetical protein KP509_29G034700 [Ceratopteris richardii]|uniref:TF-B3 domain-containing protein n=1 Tax=Ceratopteris richardii TaxID=49495 RepID=A0A8T2R749_CERRI|nr:hypothetical protein KP509_29G034700 [Ceratopteris richardii]